MSMVPSIAAGDTDSQSFVIGVKFLRTETLAF
jgi:hypothetical protein